MTDNHYNEAADEAVKDAERYLAIAKEQAPDGVYREGTEAFQNLAEGNVHLGIAIGLRYAAQMESE